MKTLMRLCVPAVLGVAALFSVAPTAQAVVPATQPTHTAPVNVLVDGPFYTYSGALADARVRAAEGFDWEIDYDAGLDVYFVYFN